MHFFGQCDATFDYYNNKWAEAADTLYKPVILGDHGGVFTSSPAGLIFNDVNTGEIILSSSTPQNVYTITYTVSSCSHSQEIFVLNQGPGYVKLCRDTLEFTANANCEAAVSYSWHPGIFTTFNLVNESGATNGSLIPLGLDSVIGQFNRPKQFNLISENNWQQTLSPNDQKGVLPIIHSPSYNIASTGGLVVEGTGTDGLWMTVPMENRTFHGIDVSFDFRMNYDVCCFGFGYAPMNNTLFSLGNDSYTPVEFTTNPVTGLGYALRLRNPDGTVEDNLVALNYNPAEDSYQNYRFFYDPETGVLEISLNGSVIITDNYTPGAVINYIEGDVNIGSVGIIDSEIDGYGLSSDIASFNNLSITEIVLEKNRFCKRYLEVLDDTAPMINCSVTNGYNYIIEDGCELAMPNLLDSLLITENCGLDLSTYVQHPPPGTMLPHGPLSVTFNIDDSSGNSASSCSSVIHIIDDKQPIMNCNTDSIFIYSSDGLETVPNLEFTNPVLNNGCADFTYFQSPNPGDPISFGNHSVGQWVTDAANTSNACQTIISVLEFDCLNDTTIYSDADTCGTHFSYPLPPGADFKAGNGSDAFFGVGTHTEAFEISNIDTLVYFSWDNTSLSPNVPDIGPTVNSYTDIGTYAANGAGSGLSFGSSESMEYQIPSSIIEGLDNVEIGFQYRALGDARVLNFDNLEARIHNDHIHFDYFLDDSDGNGGMQSNNISGSVPDFTDLHEYIFRYDEVSGIAELIIDGTSFWQSTPTPNRTLDLTGGSSTFEIGEGLSGNGTDVVIDEFYISTFSFETCQFEVTVSDTISPVVDCPNDTTIHINNSTCDVIYNWDVPATDNCDIDTQYQFDQAAIADPNLTVGNYVYSVNTADVNGESTYCSWNVSVVDTVAPIVYCQTTQYHIWTEASSEIMPDLSHLIDIAFPDNCTSFNLIQSPAAGATITEIDNLVTFTVSDDNSNTSNCSFPLIWKRSGPFALNCPDNEFSNNLTDPSSCSSIVNFSEPTSSLGEVVQLSNEGNGSTYLVDSIYQVSYAIETQIDTILKYSWNDPIALIKSADIGPNASSWSGNANYVSDPDGGYYIQSSGDLDLSYPIEFFNELEGMEVGFRYAANNYDHSKFLRAANDFILDVDSNFYVQYNIELPGGAIEEVTGISIFDLPLDDELHDYLFRYDNQTGICQIYLDGNLEWENPNPIPNAKLVYPTATRFILGDQTAGTTMVLDDFYVNKYTSNPPCTFLVEVEDVIDPVINDCPEDTILYTSVEGCNPFYSYSLSAYDLCGDVTYTQQTGIPDIGGTYPLGITENLWYIEDESANLTTCYFEVELIDDTTPSIVCPNDTTINSEPSLCGAHLSFNIQTTDNCTSGVATWDNDNLNIDSGDLFPVGSHTNSYTYIQGGESVSCDFTVTVIDVESPYFTEIPLSDTLYLDENSCLVDYTFNISGDDNCSSYTINPIIDHASPLGLNTYSFSYEITDDNNNSDTLDWEIVVLDSISPIFTECPNDFTVQSPVNDCGEVVSYILEFEDNCTAMGDIEMTQIAGGLNDQYWPLGVFNQVYEIQDESGNVDLCEFTVFVVDTISPEIICPENETLIAENGICGAQFNYSIQISDNCAMSNSEFMTAGLPSGSIFPVGITPVHFEIEDNHMNSNGCSFSVTVLDEEAPLIDCPPSETITIELDTCAAFYSHNLNVVENCSNFSISNGISELIQDTLTIGTHIYDFDVSDNHGNDVNCYFEIEVVDETAPNFSCEDVYIEVNENCEYLVPDFSLDPSLYDCSGIESFTQSPLPNEIGSGTTLVIVSITDNLDNTNNCSFEIFGIDTMLPTAENCLSDTIIYSLPNDCGNYFNYTINPTDNCGIQDSVTNGPMSGEFLTIGSHDIEFIYWDNSSLRDTCSFTVTVVDNVLPTFDCEDIIVSDLDDNCQEQVTFTLDADDNCGILETNQLSGPLSGSIFPAGESQITYEAVDIHGNRDTCSFNVIVEAGLNWSITCPSDQSVVADNSCNFILQDYTSQASLLDTCNNIVTFIQEPMSGSTQSGTTEVTIFGTDSHGTVKTCTFNVVPPDNTPPVINCPDDTTIYVLPGHCKAIYPYEWDASDGCSIDEIEFIGYSPNDSIPIGNYPIEIVAFDGNLNSDSCSFNVTVLDTIAPVLFCDPVIIVDADGNCEQQISFDLDATDNCQIANIQQLSGPSSGDTVSVGEYVIEYTATDIYNNSDTCEFVLTVETNEPWTFECPENDTIYIQSVCEIDILNYTGQVDVNATCTEVSLEQFPSSGTINMDTTIEIVATDENDNSQNCTFDVILLDTINPSIEISLLNMSYDSLSCGAIVEYEIDATDNCGTPTFSMVGGLASGTSFPVGNTLLVYETVDPFGNAHIDSLSITVTDNYIPFISCESYMEFCDTNLTIDVPIVSDACGIDELFNSFNGTADASGIYPAGTSFVNWTVKDVNGNENNCLQEIFVEELQDVPNAGMDQTIVFDNQTDLAAEELINGNGTWQQIIGDGSIQDFNDPNTSVSNLTMGLNEFVWTADYQVCNNQSDTVVVNVINITAPNGISPDGDGQNDAFVIEGLDYFADNILQIYNRWGQLVCVRKNYQNDWLGTNSNGKVLPNDTYFYTLEVKEYNKSYNGFIVIKR